MGGLKVIYNQKLCKITYFKINHWRSCKIPSGCLFDWASIDWV